MTIDQRIEKSIELIKSSATKTGLSWKDLINKVIRKAQRQNIKLYTTNINAGIWQCLDAGFLLEKDEKLIKNSEYYTDEYSGLSDWEALRLLSRRYLRKKSCKKLVEKIAQKLERHGV